MANIEYVQRKYWSRTFAKDMSNDITLDGWELVCIHPLFEISDDLRRILEIAYIATFRRAREDRS